MSDISFGSSPQEGLLVIFYTLFWFFVPFLISYYIIFKKSKKITKRKRVLYSFLIGLIGLVLWLPLNIIIAYLITLLKEHGWI